MAYIDVRIEFSEEIENFGDETYTDYRPVKVFTVGTDIPEGDLVGIAESAFQSDLYTVGVANAMLSALDGETVIENITY